MKQTITFYLPDDSNELTFALNGKKYWHALLEIQENIRRWKKYEDLDRIDVEAIQNSFNEALYNQSINLDEVR